MKTSTLKRKKIKGPKAAQEKRKKQKPMVVQYEKELLSLNLSSLNITIADMAKVKGGPIDRWEVSFSSVRGDRILIGSIPAVKDDGSPRTRPNFMQKCQHARFTLSVVRRGSKVMEVRSLYRIGGRASNKPLMRVVNELVLTPRVVAE